MNKFLGHFRQIAKALEFCNHVGSPSGFYYLLSSHVAQEKMTRGQVENVTKAIQTPKASVRLVRDHGMVLTQSQYAS